MEKHINASDYTAQQLKNWLRKLGLPTNGTKNALVSRINDVPAEERGECPVDETDGENVESASSKELELLKREIDLLIRENELLKREKHIEASGNNCISDYKFSLILMKECIPEYDGSTNFEFWATQIENLSEIYKIDDNTFRMLLISKLKGKALSWLQSKESFLKESPNDLLKYMREFFGTKESMLIQRKKFEGRKWKQEESFNDYFIDKLILSNRIKIDEQELIDSIIDGIPDQQLKIQATMQNFTNTMQLQQAFSRLELKMPAKPKKATIRCFNCGSFGHFAAECKKPKYEKGSCYGCGSKQHLVSTCPNRKYAVHVVEDEKKRVSPGMVKTSNLQINRPMSGMRTSNSRELHAYDGPMQFISCLQNGDQILSNTNNDTLTTTTSSTTTVTTTVMPAKQINLSNITKSGNGSAKDEVEGNASESNEPKGDLIGKIEHVVMQPAPQGVLYKCCKTRDSKSMDRGLFHIYYLHLERDYFKKIFLLGGRKRKKSKTLNYAINCDPTDLSRNVEGFQQSRTPYSGVWAVGNVRPWFGTRKG